MKNVAALTSSCLWGGEGVGALASIHAPASTGRAHSFASQLLLMGWGRGRRPCQHPRTGQAHSSASQFPVSWNQNYFTYRQERQWVSQHLPSVLSRGQCDEQSRQDLWPQETSILAGKKDVKQSTGASKHQECRDREERGERREGENGLVCQPAGSTPSACSPGNQPISHGG